MEEYEEVPLYVCDPERPLPAKKPTAMRVLEQTRFVFAPGIRFTPKRMTRGGRSYTP